MRSTPAQLNSRAFVPSRASGDPGTREARPYGTPGLHAQYYANSMIYAKFITPPCCWWCEQHKWCSFQTALRAAESANRPMLNIRQTSTNTEESKPR